MIKMFVLLTGLRHLKSRSGGGEFTLTEKNKNDIFFEAIVRGLLTNKLTPVLCINRIQSLNLSKEEEAAVMVNLDNTLRVKSITVADLLKRAYKEECLRREMIS